MLNRSFAMAAQGSWGLDPSLLQPAFLIPIGFTLLVLLVLLFLRLRDLPSDRRARKAPTMTPLQLESLMMGSPPRIVDLRPRETYEGPKGHIRGAMSIPLTELRKRLHELDAKEKDAIILVDETDELSHLALPLLTGEGHNWIYVLRGGMRAWRRAKLPVYTHKPLPKA
ncbi:rhodanese-like domain-containing protein [Holophaga foetida]|uniref:rhodanese-like domain-containing protein n=1 Tax=Holophaga foetida TaxID=35839 RepID=UPI00024732D9|nr:rhodanese-like domain-containing protein [Holophaga foetida]